MATETMTTTTVPKVGVGFRQLFDEESSTYSYLLWDTATKDAILVDPVDKQIDRDLQVIRDLGLNLVYGVNTHAHADHVTGTWLLKQQASSTTSIISAASGAVADKHVNPGDRIYFSKDSGRFVTALATPGHTKGCMSFVADDESFVLTGDALLIQGCGRTDFQGGLATELYDSVHSQLFGKLPDDCVVYPAHDYKGQTSSTIGAERTTNPRFTQSKEDFVKTMANLNLPYPKKIDVAVPANMRCGAPDV